MSDSFTEVSETSWFGRIGESIKGVLVGLVLIVVGIGVLFWNEGRAVRIAADLAEGGKNMVSVKSDAIDPANEGKLIHFNAAASSDSTVEDPVFKVAPGKGVLRLKRAVEMYQWEEKKETRTEKKLGGGERKTTTYSYSRKWSGDLIDSSRFNQQGGHVNPSAMPFNTQVFSAEAIKAGAFTLPGPLVEKLDEFSKFPVENPSTSAGADVKSYDGGFYKGADPANPETGDAKVMFSVIRSGPVSVYGKQVNGQLVPYVGKQGTELFDLRAGTLTAAEMIQKAQAENRLLTWILRLCGFIAISIGFGLTLNPLVTIADVVPLFGNILGFGIFIAAVLLGAVVSSITIAIAWLFYRPMLSVGLLAGVVLIVWWVRSRGRARRLALQPAMAGARGPGAYPPPPPPPGGYPPPPPPMPGR